MPRVWPRRIALLFIMVWTTVQVCRVILFSLAARVSSVDLAIFFEGTLALAELRPFNNAIQHIQMFGLVDYARADGVASGFHFHRNFIMILVAPLVAIFRHPVVLQVSAVLSTGLAMYFGLRLSERSLTNSWHCFATTIAFAMIPAIMHAALGFEPSVFAWPLILGFFLAAHTSRRWAILLCAFLLLLVREDYSLLCFSLGIWLWVRGPDHMMGSIVAALSLLYGLTFLVFYAAIFGGDGDAISSLKLFRSFGESNSDIAVAILSRPATTLEVLFRERALVYIALLVFPFLPALLRFRAHTIWPLIGVYILSESRTALEVYLHYSWPVIAVLFAAWIHSLASMPTRWQWLWISLCIVSLAAQNPLWDRPRFESNLSINAMRARTIDGERELFAVFRDGSSIERLFDAIPEHEPIAVDLRAPNVWLYALARDAEATVSPRALEQRRYAVRVYWPQRIYEREPWKEFRAAAELDEAVFDQHWQEVESYERLDGAIVSLWRRGLHSSSPGGSE